MDINENYLKDNNIHTVDWLHLVNFHVSFYFHRLKKTKVSFFVCLFRKATLCQQD